MYVMNKFSKNTTAKERLLMFLENEGIGQSKFEEMCGIARGNISKIKDSIRSTTIAKISRTFPNLDVRWLTTGEGQMYLCNDNQGFSNINANYSVVGNNSSINNITPNQYGDSPDIERKWAPVVPRAMASMPDFDIIGHIKKQMPGGNVERLYSGTLDIDIWHYIETRNLEPKFEKGDCLGLKSFEVGDEFIREGDIHVVDTKSKGLVTTLLFSDGNGGYYGMATFPKEHKDVVIPKEDVIRIYRKVIMFRY